MYAPIWQGPLDIGELLRLPLSVDLLNMCVQIHRPIGKIQFIKGTAHVLRQEAKHGAGLLVGEAQVTVQVKHHLRHGGGVKGRIPQADMAYEGVAHL